MKSFKQTLNGTSIAPQQPHEETERKRKANSDEPESNNCKSIKINTLDDISNKETYKKTEFDWPSAISSILSKKSEKTQSGLKIKTLKKKLIKRYALF